MQAGAPHLSQCCFRIEVQKSQNLKLGPLFSYKRLNFKSWSFWIENDVKTLGKERELRDAQSSGAVSFLAF